MENKETIPNRLWKIAKELLDLCECRPKDKLCFHTIHAEEIMSQAAQLETWRKNGRLE